MQEEVPYKQKGNSYVSLKSFDQFISIVNIL